jgi:hypothetical protein
MHLTEAIHHLSEHQRSLLLVAEEQALQISLAKVETVVRAVVVEPPQVREAHPLPTKVSLEV